MTVIVKILFVLRTF